MYPVMKELILVSVNAVKLECALALILSLLLATTRLIIWSVVCIYVVTTPTFN